MTNPTNGTSQNGIHESRPKGARRLPFFPLIEIPKKTGDPVFVACLSQRLTIVATHWHNDLKKVLYCAGENGCQMCHQGWMPRVYGYAAGQLLRQIADAWHLGKKVLIRIPEAALTNSADNIMDRTDLRGRFLTLRRFSASGPNAPVKVEVHGLLRHHIEALSPAWDVLGDVARRFGLVKPVEEK